MTHHVELRGGGNLIIRAEAETRLDVGTRNSAPEVILFRNLAWIKTSEVVGSGSDHTRTVYRLASTARLINVEGN